MEVSLLSAVGGSLLRTSARSVKGAVTASGGTDLCSSAFSGTPANLLRSEKSKVSTSSPSFTDKESRSSAARVACCMVVGGEGKGAACTLHESEDDATGSVVDCCRRGNCGRVDDPFLGVPSWEGNFSCAGSAVSGAGVGGV